MLLALWSITLRQWRHHRLRLALTTMGITLGVGVFFGIRTANATLLSSLRVTVEKVAGKATLQVAAGEAGFPEEVLDKVRATPGVQIAEPVIEVIAQTPYSTEGSLLVLGVDTAGDHALRDYEFDQSQTTISDPLVFLAQPNSILISKAFAERHALKIGDTLPLFASSGRKDFVVQGIFKPVGVGEVFGGNIAVMDVYSAQAVFDRGHNFDHIDIMTAPNVPVETVRQRLRAQFPAGIAVQDPEVRGQALENTVAGMQIGIRITSFIALLVGVYIIFNSFSIAVNQRWKEIGILRAVGVERRNVKAMFLFEAGIMGVIGSVLGVVFGYYLAVVAARVMGSMAAKVYGMVSTPQPPVLRLDYALAALALGIVASLLGAWFPARAAAQLDPIMALHNIETRRSESVLGRFRLVVGLLLSLGGMALVRWVPIHAGAKDEHNFYAVITLLGLTALLPQFVQWAALALRPIMDFAGGSEGALAVDAMIRSPRRSSATVGALMAGLMFVFSTSAYIQSYRHMIDRWVKQMVNADIIMTSSAMLRSSTYHFSEDIGKQIATLPEVKRIENVRFTAVPYQGDTAALIAIEMGGFLSRAQDAVEGSSQSTLLDLMPKGQGLIVSRNFSNRWQLGVGDTVRLETPTGPLERKILGIVDDYRSEKGTIFMERALYKQYWHDSAVDFFDINLQPGTDQNAAKADIQRLTAGSVHAFIYTNAEFKGWISSLVDQFFILNYMQLVIAVLVAMLGIVNTLVISIAERRREIGVIRAIGGLRAQIRKLVLLEAVALSIVGVGAGAVAGLFTTEYMSHTVSLALAGYSMPFSFPWKPILISLPVAVIGALVAGWFPAQRAVSTPVIEAIGYE